MPRPPKPRLVEFFPNVTYFKPAGIPMTALGEVRLGVDEIEALRLKDVEGLGQEECAARMNVAQSTFQRLLSAAREKLTRGIVEGKAIRIEGGPFQLIARTYVCPDCGRRWRENPVGQAYPAGGPAGARVGAPAEGSDAAPAPAVKCPACGGDKARPEWRHGRR